jgi:internalin A
MTPAAGYVLEDTSEGRTLVVTGPWTGDAEGILIRGEADGLVLNYARGFREGSLEFLDRWDVRRLKVLDRRITDLGPIGRLGDSLEALSVQAAASAQLDLAAVPHVRSVSGEWALIGDTLGEVHALHDVITWRFDEADLHVFRDRVGLQLLTLKEAPHLESLSGIADLPELAVLKIFRARRLSDLSDAAELAVSLRELELEDCPALDTIEDVEQLVGLRFLGFSECGDIETLAPIGSLEELEVLHAWGSTRIVDGDLTPLARLPRLREIRMQDRRGYRPRVADVVTALAR